MRIFLDNEAARGSLINGSSSQTQGAHLVRAFVWTEMKIQVKVWFARVPTSSNVADDPSRMQVQELERRNIRRRKIHWKTLLAKLRKEGSVTWGFNTGS